MPHFIQERTVQSTRSSDEVPVYACLEQIITDLKTVMPHILLLNLLYEIRNTGSSSTTINTIVFTTNKRALQVLLLLCSTLQLVLPTT